MSVENENLYWKNGGVSGLISRAIIRSLQTVFAITTAVLYGLDLARATDNGAKPGSMWIYAEVVSACSLLICLGHLFFTMTKLRWSTVDWVIFILWVAQFGVFGTIFLGSSSTDRGGPYSDHGRMLAAVWIDMINMLLWLASCSVSLIQCCTRCCQRKQQRETVVIKLADMESGRVADMPSPKFSLPAFPPDSTEGIPSSPPPKYSTCS